MQSSVEIGNPIYEERFDPSQETKTHEIPCSLEDESEVNVKVTITVTTQGSSELVEVERVETDGQNFSCIEDDIHGWLREHYTNAQIKFNTL